jgi:hypothetical protein
LLSFALLCLVFGLYFRCGLVLGLFLFDSSGFLLFCSLARSIRQPAVVVIANLRRRNVIRLDECQFSQIGSFNGHIQQGNPSERSVCRSVS